MTKDSDSTFEAIYAEKKEEVANTNAKVDAIVMALNVASIGVMFIDGVSVKLTDMAAKKLIKEAIEEGLKISPDKIVSIAKVDGKIVWLEKGYQAGDKGAGLEHIFTHSTEFAQKGIAKEQIAQTVMKAVQENNIVGQTSSGMVYRTIVDGKVVDINIGIGSNGFVVRANPISPKNYKPIE